MAGAAGASLQQRNKRADRTSVAGIASALAMVTILSAIAGGLFGLYARAVMEQPHRTQNELPSSQTTTPAPAYSESGSVRALPPVVTKLAGPQPAWVRIEASIVLAGPASNGDEVLAAEIAEDMVAFLQTVTSSDIEGASGFLHLREDLADRVRVRSDGRVRDLVLHTFIVE